MFGGASARAPDKRWVAAARVEVHRRDDVPVVQRIGAQTPEIGTRPPDTQPS
jgi:hypothetical protein